MRPTLLLAAALATLAPFPADAGTPRLRRLAVVGDSLLAGFASGGFVRRDQYWSPPAQIARRARVRLAQPLMKGPGVPPPYVIDDANRNGVLDPGEVHRKANGIGFRVDPDVAVRNLAVPGEDSETVFDTIGVPDIAGQLLAGDTPEGRDILKFLILGLPLRNSDVSQLTRLPKVHPTFVLVWLGNNDVLDMAAKTNPDAVLSPPAAFGQRFRRLLARVADTGATMAVANLPDVTGIAALRPAAADVTACKLPDGTLRPVAPDDELSVDLPRSTLPNPPCGKVLDATKRAQARATVMAYNAEIAAAVADLEASRGVAVALVDTFALFDDARTNGVDVGDGTRLSTSYLGGVFSLDGVHPTHAGYAFVANAFIDAIDQRFGETIPRVDVGRVAAKDKLVNSRFRPSGAPPFGLFGDDDVDVVGGFFGDVFDRIQQGAEDLGHDLKDAFSDVIDTLSHLF